jgi:NADPH2:quinone reductase
MRAVVVEQPGVVRVTDVPEPVAGPGEVVIEVGACGICGTDIHIIDGEYPPAEYPCIIGHEFGGTIVQVGEGVTRFKLGDRVGADPNFPCMGCFHCQQGESNMCLNLTGTGTTNPGALAERVAVPERVVYALPDGMTWLQAALIEPVSCVVHGYHRLDPKIGESYLIFGAGPIGLQLAQIARFNGAGVVAIVDINEGRLARARDDFGFEHVATRWEDLRHLAPIGFDNAIDATGVPRVVEMALYSLRRRGKLLVFGVCPPGEKGCFDLFKIFSEELSIIGTMSLVHSYGPAIKAIGAGAVDADKVVSHTFGLEDFADALAMVRSGAGLKVQISGL